MPINKYDDMNLIQLDVMKEIGSIGTGNAATALSSMLSKKIRMTVPDVSIAGYNEAIKKIGDPEEVVAGVLVCMSGEMEGIMLFMLKLDFINIVLEQLCNKRIDNYTMLGEMEISALEEIGNIIISSYVNALSKLTDMSINLSVPAIAVNMLGGILSVPMAEFGYITDKLMMIDGNFICDSTEVTSNLLMMPDMESLNCLLKKLGMNYE